MIEALTMPVLLLALLCERLHERLQQDGTPPPVGHPRCPRGAHWIMVPTAHNEFGCGYCRRKGGPEELRAFYDQVRRAQ
jgi:hypothetical protein